MFFDFDINNGLVQLKLITKIFKKMCDLVNNVSCLEKFLLLIAKKYIHYSRSHILKPKFHAAVHLFKFYRKLMHVLIFSKEK